MTQMARRIRAIYHQFMSRDLSQSYFPSIFQCSLKLEKKKILVLGKEVAFFFFAEVSAVCLHYWAWRSWHGPLRSRFSHVCQKLGSHNLLGSSSLLFSHDKLSQHLRLFSKPTKAPERLQPDTNVKIMLWCWPVFGEPSDAFCSINRLNILQFSITTTLILCT